MQPADGVDAVETRSRWRGVLLGVGLGLAAGLLTLLAPQAAHADDGDAGGALGSLVQGPAASVSDVVTPVVAPLPDARELPLVGEALGAVVDSRPVGAVTAPVADLADGLLGTTVGSLPLVGGLLGDDPVASVTAPVGELVDGTVGVLAGVPEAPDAVLPDATDASGALLPRFAGAGFATAELAASALARGMDLTADAVGIPAPVPGNGFMPGDAVPASVVTAGGSSIALVAGVLGAALLFLLARGRVRPGVFRAPPAPVFATDTSPD